MTATILKLKEKPILFSTPMVQAILNGSKTQTRRQIKLPSWATNWRDFETDGKKAQIICEKTGCLGDIECPYGKIGDYLWVRETWRQAEDGYEYYADTCCQHPGIKWKPSIHMPRAVSRISLQIIDIRIERLQNITEQDAIAEGVRRADWLPSSNTWLDYLDDTLVTNSARSSFETLWSSINGCASWYKNPYIWVVEFKKS